MAFELGLFLGCRQFSAPPSDPKDPNVPNQNEKQFLVLDEVPHRFRTSLSDFAGNDVETHNNDPEHVIRVVRDWLSNTAGERMYGAVKLQREFRIFEADLPVMASDYAASVNDIGYADLCFLIEEWIRAQPPVIAH